MKKSRLYEVFDRLTKQEIRELRKFVQSPYYNQQESICQLLEYLVACKYRLKLDPSKEKAFKIIYPKLAFNDVKVRLLMSTLHKLIEQFLVQADFTKDTLKSKVRLAAIYRKLNLPKHFQKTLNESIQLQEKSIFRDYEYFNDRYHLQIEEYQFISASKRTISLNLQEISDTIDIAYLATKLRQTCMLLAHQSVYKAEYEFGLLEQILDYILEQNLLAIPAIAVYYHCYQSIIHPKEENHFQAFKQLIFEHGAKFSNDELRGLYVFAVNYCIKKMNSGQSAFTREGLDLYKEGLRTSVLLDNQKLSRFTFNNIVAMGLKSKEYNWVDQFIDDYQRFLEKDYQKSIVNFNRARLEYERKNYDHALTLLRDSEFKDFINNLIAKTLQLKIYYELDEYKLLESHLEAMKVYIKRKNVLGYHQVNYQYIVQYTKQLIQVNPFDRKEKITLKKAIEEAPVLTEKKWLLTQLDNL